MAELFFTAFMADNNILDIFLIRCELRCMIKHARHLWSKTANVKSSRANVSVNKYAETVNTNNSFACSLQGRDELTSTTVLAMALPSYLGEQGRCSPRLLITHWESKRSEQFPSGDLKAEGQQIQGGERGFYCGIREFPEGETEG